jgi:protein kinase A
MAATVAHSQALGHGLHPLQAAALQAAGDGQEQLQQNHQEQRALDEEPFDVSSARKLSPADFERVRTLGTGTALLSGPARGTNGPS